MSESEPTLKDEDEKEHSKRKRVFWKGKLVSEKVYRKRVQQTELAKSLHRRGFSKQNSNLKNGEKEIIKESESTVATSSTSLTISDSSTGVNVHRSFHLETFDKLCRKCKSILLLEDVKVDQRNGIVSKFDVECRHCHAITTSWAYKLDMGSNTCTDTAVLDTLNEDSSTSTILTDSDVNLEGRRIIHLKTLGLQMFCTKCESVLSLLDIKDEKQFGLAFVFMVECRHCHAITRVSTDKQHKVLNRSQHFDMNTKAVLGTLNGGQGHWHVNKFLSSINSPQFYWNSYKSHEAEVGNAIEIVAQDSCLEAAYEERRLTIENSEKLKQLL